LIKTVVTLQAYGVIKDKRETNLILLSKGTVAAFFSILMASFFKRF